ncbi:uncharacterized protein LOC128676420 isoform X2 [Plodia interpunctella]|nr:uncharacterized protein LOC128676420 isoform X2 [Plodia interpunctella]XP_053612684.1 uncharacterized protein LOC128676420 isoform X2 [Plodia interpunctella]
MEREEAKRTRPRVIMTPGVIIDDTDEKTYNLLVKDKYMSTAMKDYHAHPEIGCPVVSPLVPVPAPPLPIKIKKYNPYYLVSPEWRMDSVTWDTRQDRSCCHPTKEFWTRGRPKDQPIGHNK